MRVPVDLLLYSQVAKFSDQVKRYFNVFDRSKVWIIIYDDLKNATARVLWRDPGVSGSKSFI